MPFFKITFYIFFLNNWQPEVFCLTTFQSSANVSLNLTFNVTHAQVEQAEFHKVSAGLYQLLTTVCSVSIWSRTTGEFHSPSFSSNKDINILKHILRACHFLPAYVVGLAWGLQLKTVWFLFFLVWADRDDGLTPAFWACCLVTEWTWAEQHAVAVLWRNLCGTRITALWQWTVML